MPLVRFLGFPDGAAVSLSASQGDASASVSVANWNAGPTLSIDVVRAPAAGQYAPEAVWFYARPEGFGVSDAPAASVAYDPEFHEIEYEWDFGDAGDVFTAPQNLLDVHRDANKAVGMQAAHVFRNHGSYTVRCTARRIVDTETMEVEEAVATAQVVVGDPETIFDASNTIVVAHDGDFTDAPASDHQLTGWTDWDDATHWHGLLRSSSFPDNQPVRVLFKCGGDYTNSNNGLAHNTSHRRYTFMMFGSWGSGAKPISRWTRAWSIDVPSIWQGIHFRGDYDDVTEIGSDGFAFEQRGNFYSLLTGCDLTNRGAGFGHTGQTADSPAMNTLHDCTLQSLSAYGVFHFGRPADYDGNGSKDRLALLGIRDVDSAAAPHGRGSPNGQKQGPVRMGAREDVVISGCEFFNRFGWTGQGNWEDGRSATAVQPSIRIASGAPDFASQRNGDVVVSRCTSEGGALVDQTGEQNVRPRIGNTLVDQCVAIGLPSSANFGKSEVGALTWRNTLHIKPNVANAFTLGNLIGIQGANKIVPYDEVAHDAEPVRIYSNTFIILDDSALGQGAFFGLDGYDTYVETNNVIYVAGNTNYVRHENIAPFDTTELWPSLYAGRNEYEGGVTEGLQTQYETPAGTISLYRPASTSLVVNSAMGTISYTDLLGDPRIATQSRGAVEP